MRIAHYRTWNMARNTENRGEKTNCRTCKNGRNIGKFGKRETHTVGPRIL